MSPTPGLPVRLQAFPSSDRRFVAFVQAAWDGLRGPRTPAVLQEAIRSRYPAAIVTTQHELAQHGDEPLVWYAFRTGGIEPLGPLGGHAGRPGDRGQSVDPTGATGWQPGAGPRPEGEGEWPAWAVLDDDRRFVEISPHLAEVAELPPERMVGHRVEDFSNPADPTIREDISRLWLEFLRRRSIASTLRFNFRDGTPRELEYRLVADAAGPGRHRLSVRELER